MSGQQNTLRLERNMSALYALFELWQPSLHLKFVSSPKSNTSISFCLASLTLSFCWLNGMIHTHKHTSKFCLLSYYVNTRCYVDSAEPVSLFTSVYIVHYNASTQPSTHSCLNLSSDIIRSDKCFIKQTSDFQTVRIYHYVNTKKT